MKKISILLFLFLFTQPSFSQNMVMNPGLDGFITCPGFGQFSNSYVYAWDKPSYGSSDYYNYNCPGILPTMQVPRTGESYAGIIGYNYGTEYREYITGTFYSPLVAGTLYDVEFWVSLNDGYIQAIEEMGAYISISPPGPFPNALHINVIPQIVNSSGALGDTANWKRINGQYLATGGEQFITIGNFNDDSTTTITQPGSSGSYGAYYFIDDVSVIADSTTSIIESGSVEGININVLSGNILQIIVPSAPKQNSDYRLFVYNASGKLVVEKQIKENVSQVDASNLPSGIYFVRIWNGIGKNFSARVPLIR